ncbi:16S rRNA (cytosine(967)-C(5))-methyltransferase RsmB [Paenibacillus bouchesdurhonensis]|uniref:16S rRNA (cytosine(967)-C(5))-methyltransferase RsmB n=1 Tax=Paenibacillus bouchesdurhonensis TaxID=1870990 RepID=UPI000DA62F73|nr:16S rRNA (cytosine(967)-C(5))-methyltransferase RsmB [Paenibacillus bouchesdurhonensis]
MSRKQESRPGDGVRGRQGSAGNAAPKAGQQGVKGGSRRQHKASARDTALHVLTEVEQEGAYSNLLLNSALQKSGLTGAEAGLATELVYGTISRRNTIDYYLEQFVAKGMAKLQPWVRNLLRLSFYQIFYLDRIPPHAAVNEAVNIAKRRGHQGISGMVNGVLRNVLRRKDELKLPKDLSPARRIALEHSHPEWLVSRWIEQYGEKTAEEICRVNNESPPVSVRINGTRITRDELMQKMEEQGLKVAASRVSPDGIIVLSGGNMALTGWYRDGLLSIQDESSMLVAEAVAPEAGMSVLDCCAAPGGKTCHMAERMKGEGQIIANDIHPHKAKLIEDQAARLQLGNVQALSGDALELDKHFAPESFDRILLDAPCSGLGVIRRKPDLKWVKTPEDITEITKMQRNLLDRASTLLKPGGVLVYSTCTIEPSENEEMVKQFLDRHTEFELAPKLPEWQRFSQKVSRENEEIEINAETIGLQILPQHYHSDGFYIARLTKRANA